MNALFLNLRIGVSALNAAKIGLVVILSSVRWDGYAAGNNFVVGKTRICAPNTVDVAKGTGKKENRGQGK
jgi:hypothetical protein